LEDRSWQVVDMWMRAYGDKLMRVVYLIVHDYHLAEEITQEVFVRAYRSMETFRGDASIYTWLYRIALNLSRNHLSRRSKIRFIPFGHQEKENDLTESLEEKVVQSTVNKQIRNCIRALPVKYREVIILHYFEQMKITEISQILQQPEGTVKSKISRARVLLEKRMRKEGLADDGERSF